MDMLREGRSARGVLGRASFENGIAGVAATGGSTNAVLHLLALAHEVDLELEIDDFDRISARTPIIADLKPGGRYSAVDLGRAGGVQLVARRLIEAGLLDGGRHRHRAQPRRRGRRRRGDPRPGGGPPRSPRRSSRPAAW